MDQDFAEVIQRMARDKGKEIFVNREWRKWLPDYLENWYQKEGDLLRRILEAGGGAFINSATVVPNWSLRSAQTPGTSRRQTGEGYARVVM
jgi:hypothetical protein